MKLSQPMPKSLPSTESRFSVGLIGLLEDGVERLGQALARSDAIDRRVLHAVGNPQVRDAGLAERLAHGGADAPAGDAVIDPERPDGLVSVRQRDVVGRLRVRKVRRVEVEADAEAFGPVDPAGEVLGSDLVAIDGLAAELTVRGVEVEAVRAGNDRERERRIGAQVVGRPRLSWIVASRGEAAAETRAELLEPLDIVALPAVQGDWHRAEARQRRVGIHPGFGVAILGNRVGAIDPSGHHHYLSRGAPVHMTGGRGIIRATARFERLEFQSSPDRCGRESAGRKPRVNSRTPSLVYEVPAGRLSMP